MVNDRLLGGINNATRDLGTYCLAAWIPWKFRELAKGPRDFVKKKYMPFREAAEVAISHTLRDGATAVRKHGAIRNNVGKNQRFKPGKLSFKSVKRRVSVFDAAYYGPSLKALGLLTPYSRSRDGLRRVQIPLIREGDQASLLMAETVDGWLQKSPHYSKLNNLGSTSFTSKIVDNLGGHGLNPARYRKAGKKLKRAFLSKLLPDVQANPRNLTARLIVETLGRRKNLTVNLLRRSWHTGFLPGGRRLVIKDPALEEHRKRWAFFISRQYQRYIVEWFLRIFEEALIRKHNSIDSITDYALREYCPGEGSNLRSCIASVCRDFSRSKDLGKLSAAWGEKVHPTDDRYDWVDDDSIIATIAKWFLRMNSLRACFAGWSEGEEMYHSGGYSRISMGMFFSWINERLGCSLKELLKDAFRQLVFAQHLKVALGRLDGQNQRLRFSLDDLGITPSKAFEEKMPAKPNYMRDRLDAFVHLLCDAGALQESANGALQPGDLVDCITG